MSETSLSNKVKQKKRRMIFFICVGVLLAAGLAVSLIFYGSDAKKDPAERDGTVTLEIRCDQVSSDTQLLEKLGLSDYIPADGVILAPTECRVTVGSTTVFDVLDATCREQEIQIEYTYTPGYNGYYVQGIDYLYEFAAGKSSGWMFTVNGEAPNYGCDQVTLNDGDTVCWYYTADYENEGME